MRDPVALLVTKSQTFATSGQGAPSIHAILQEASDYSGNPRALAAVIMLLGFQWPESFYATIYPALAAATALAWAETGVSQMIDMASADPQGPATRAIITALAYASMNSTELPYVEELGRSTLTKIDGAIRDNEDVRAAAWQGLLALLGGHANEAIVKVATQLIRLLPPAHEKVTQTIVLALSARYFRLGPIVIAELEQLIKTHPKDEPKFQKFFTDHPQLLDPLVHEVYPLFELGDRKIPDFVLRRIDDTYVVVEIETPAKKLMTKAGSIGAEATHARTQVRDYVEQLEKNLVETRTKFPNFRSPDGLAIVGLEVTLSDDLRDKLSVENTQHKVTRLAGYDWLVTRARALLRNFTEDPRVVRDRMR